MSKLIAGVGSGKTELNLGAEITIPITFKMSDVKKPSSRSGSFSKTIKIPGTRINNAFFGGLYDPSSDFTQFNPNIRTPCILTIENNEVLNGFLQLKSIDVDDLGYITYNIVVYDLTVDVITKIGKLLVVGNPRDLTEISNSTRSKNDIKFNDEPLATPAIIRDTQSNMNHDYEYSKVSGSWNQTWDEVGYFYPLLYSTKGILNIVDFQPAVYHKVLLDGIMKHHGYTWSGNLKDNSSYEREVIPYTGIVPKEGISISQLRTFKAGSITGLDEIASIIAPDPTAFWGAINTDRLLYFSNVTGIFTNSTGVWNTISTYTAPNTGKYYFNTNLNFTTELEYVRGVGTVSGTLYHKLNLALKAEVYNDSNVLQYVTDPQLLGETDIELLTAAFVNHEGSDTFNSDEEKTFDVQRISNGTNEKYFDLQTGWTVKWLIEVRSDGLTFSDGSIYTGSVYDVNELVVSFNSAGSPCFIECLNVEGELEEWQSIDYSVFIPKKLKQIDIINDLISRYNCLIYVNPENQNDIIFNIAEEFYEAGSVLDWSNKKDNNKRDDLKMLGELQEGEALLTYTESKDTTNVDYKNASGEIFGQFEYDFDNDFVKGTKEIKTPFEPTPLIMQGNGDPSIVPALSVNDSNAKFRVLYAADNLISPKTTLNSGKYFTITYKSNQGSSVYTTIENFTYPYAGCFNYPIDPNTAITTSHKPLIWESINFGKLAFLGSFLNGLQPEITLEYKYWRDTLRQISISRLLTCDFNLNSSDIDYVKRNPNIKIWVNNKYWRINTANFEGNDNIRRLTKVELVSIE